MHSQRLIIAALSLGVTACSSAPHRPADASRGPGGAAAGPDAEPADDVSGAKPPDQRCRAWVLYSYEGQILRDAITPPLYGWVDIVMGDEMSPQHGEGLWFWRGSSLENLDYVTRRVLEDDGSHARSHHLVRTTLKGESTVLYDDPVDDDGYGDHRSAAEWATKQYEGYPPTYGYRGPEFAVVSVDDRHVGLVLYDGPRIVHAEYAAVDFEGNSVEVAHQREPQWEDTTPPLGLATAPNDCGEVSVIDGHLHARSGDSSRVVEIERPTSSEPIGRLIAVQWLTDGAAPPRDEMETITRSRRAESNSVLAEAQAATADGETKAARSLLASALLADGDNLELLFAYGKLALEDEHLEAAQHALVAAYDHSLYTRDRRAFRGRLLHELGRLAEAQGDIDGANEMYQRSLELRR